MKEKINRQEKILDRLLEWIRAADARIAPLAALNTAMLAVVAALAPSASDWAPISIVAGSIAAMLLAGSLVFLARATFPRTEGPQGSVVYFEGIKSRDTESYIKTINNLTETDYLSDLIVQSYRNAEIASVKFGYVRLAMIAWFIGIVPWALTLSLLVLAKD